MNDQRLLALLSEKPEEAIKHLMDDYMGLVYSIIHHAISGILSREDVEECVSDVFFLCYKQRKSIDLEKASIKGYLCMIAKRKAIDRYRSAKRKPQTDLLDEMLPVADHQAILPEEHIANLEQNRTLIEAIGDLGEPDAEILLRKYYLYEPSKLIAKRLDMTVSAVDSRASRAVAKLQTVKGSVL